MSKVLDNIGVFCFGKNRGDAVHGSGSHSRRKRYAALLLTFALVASGVALASLVSTDKEGSAGSDLETFLNLHDLPERAPFLASSGVLAGGATGDEFGYSVAYAGDFNNDSIDDVIVGAPWADNATTNDGKAYIFYGGSGGDGIPTTADVTLIGETEYDGKFGASVAGGGDFNDDGIDDVVVGAPDLEVKVSEDPEVWEKHGRAYVFLGSGYSSGTTLYASLADFMVEGEGHYDWMGWSVSFAGNFDNNNSEDILVGAMGWDSGPDPDHNVRVGRAYLLLSPGTDPLIDATFSGTQTSEWFAYSLSYAGDVNNTGYDDIIVGAPYYATSNNTTAGRAYVFFGSANPSGDTLASNADVIINGETDGDKFGWSVSNANDVDYDGNDDDVIVGAPGYDDGGSSDAGRAYIFKGALGTPIYASSADVTMTGEMSGANLGNSVSDAGDYNDDNYDDVIVGAYLEDTFPSGGTDAGKAHIFYGGSSMDGKVDITMVGDTSSSNRYKFGYSVSYAGDWDDDMYDEVIVGARYSESSRGYAHVYNFHDHWTSAGDPASVFGEMRGYSVASAGRFNNDSYDDVIVGAPRFGGFGSSLKGQAYIFYGSSTGLSSTPDLALAGESMNDNFGWSVGSGDFNNDGFDDVIVGAPLYDLNFSFDIGRAYIFYGGASPDSTADVTMTGENAGDKFGWSVSTAGDFGNTTGFACDGIDDAIVGAPLYDSGMSSDVGKAYIFYGSTWMNSVADVTMVGETANDQFGYSVSSAGNVNSTDGCDDVIVGAPYYDDTTMGMPGNVDAGKAYIFYGNSASPSTADWTKMGGAAGDKFGWSVSNAGDTNNDGYGDVVIGAPEYDNGGSSNAGRAYIFNGGSSMDTTVDVTLSGEGAAGDKFGFSVSYAGNVDNDSYDDVVVGAPLNDVGGTSSGRVFIYYGSSTVNDREDVMMTGTTYYSTGEQLGFAVADAGDVNNDNYDDVITGAPYWFTENGRAKVWGDPS